MNKIASLALVAVILLGASPVQASANVTQAPGQLPLFETTEFFFEFSGWKGNPFDVIALAKFVHVPTNQTRVTELFYVGDNRWSFRFTGDKLGKWRWKTLSQHSALNGHSGKIELIPQENPDIKGFLSHDGNQYVRQNHLGEVEGALFYVYMNSVEYPTSNNKPASEPALGRFHDESYIDAYLDDAWRHGFDTVFVLVGEPELWMNSTKLDAEPNLPIFDILDNIIKRAHGRGMRVHLWKWKDAQRGSTPNQFAGGVNGVVDQRLQRYIAARLGPLPGWSMSYGFDLHEWTNSDQLNAWVNYLHQHMGWDHLLASRGFRLESAVNVINSYDGYGRKVELTTTYAGPKDYREIREDMDSDLSRPHLYEERHSYRRPGHKLDMDGTRRLLWWSAMAGGMGGFVGFFGEDRGAYGGYPYPAPEQLKVFGEFWRQHWQSDYKVCNQFSNGYGLCGAKRFVFYRTAAKKIKMELPEFEGELRFRALNTVTGEWLDVGMKKSTFREFVAPRRSDWLLVAGDFQ